jgi:DNA-binding transcriptional LysR family regulator
MDEGDLAPPLKCLAAFEATVRLQSMTAAARELGTTQPAVSQRIRQLEDMLGLPLFDRGGRRLQPTRDGLAYHEEVASALRRIRGATRRLRARANARGRELTIAVHFGFAHLWLLPRLARLEAAFPGTAFEVLPVDSAPREAAPGADLAVRFGTFAERGTHEHPLFPERVQPVCSPAFARRHALDGALGADAPTRLALLHMDDRDPRWLDWPRWSERAGLAIPPGAPRFRYNNYPLLLNAAIEGSGLALGWRGLVDTLVSEGTLVALGPTVERPERGYLLEAPDEHSAAVAPIVDWFLRECAAAG